MSALPDAVKWNADGLVAAIVQDALSGRVLMQAWMDREALSLTLSSGQACFWSRSRGEIWIKGATSGNTQTVREVRLDCDGDAILLLVEPAGPACHTGAESCFFQRAGSSGEWQSTEPAVTGVLAALGEILEQRKLAPPDESYVAGLYASGREKILRKLGEEAVETLLAGQSADAGELAHEVADLWFHSLVLLADAGVTPQTVLNELATRFGVSGLVEKAARTAAGES